MNREEVKAKPKAGEKYIDMIGWTVTIIDEPNPNETDPILKGKYYCENEFGTPCYRPEEFLINQQTK